MVGCYHSVMSMHTASSDMFLCNLRISFPVKKIYFSKNALRASRNDRIEWLKKESPSEEGLDRAIMRFELSNAAWSNY